MAEKEERGASKVEFERGKSSSKAASSFRKKTLPSRQYGGLAFGGREVRRWQAFKHGDVDIKRYCIKACCFHRDIFGMIELQ